jgi:hypothetical protein
LASKVLGVQVGNKDNKDNKDNRVALLVVANKEEHGDNKIKVQSDNKVHGDKPNQAN